MADLPESPESESYVDSIGASAHLHPDFGTNPSYGIPYTIVPASQPKVPIKFTKYGSESDPGPYPVPPNAPIEGGGKNGRGDRHVLVAQEGSCTLYELYDAHSRRKGKSWTASTARSSTCAAARYARKGGPPPTPPGCRSSRCSPVTPRSPPARSTTPCG